MQKARGLNELEDELAAKSKLLLTGTHSLHIVRRLMMWRRIKMMLLPLR
jgi:hypothetical protein